MFLKEIKEFDKHSGEADVVVSDGQYEVICYCHPFENNKIGSKITEINTLFAYEIMRIKDKRFYIQKIDDYYSYYFYGKVVNANRALISIGGIIIRLDNDLSKDIKEGEFIEFKVKRLDCIMN